MATLCTFILNERAGYARTSETVDVFVPLAETDAIASVSSLSVTESGVAIDATFTPVSRWWGTVTDGTKYLKVVRVSFRASLTANQIDSTTYALTDGGTGSTTTGITVTDAGTYYEVTTGLATGSGRFRIRKTSGGGHNIFEKAEVRTSAAAWKVVVDVSNDSALYLHGVATAQDAPYATSTGLGVISGNQLANKTVIVTVNGVPSTYTFAASAPTTAIGVEAAIAGAYNRGLGSISFGARCTDNTFSNIELRVGDGKTATIGNGTANALLGFTNGQALTSSQDNQNADYKSNAYTGGDYSVAGIETPSGNLTSLSGGDTCTILVSGKFGATPFVGFHDESDTGNSANGVECRNRAALSYEARYTFYRNSAYVGIDILWKGAGGSQNQNDVGDAAIDWGGLRIVPNFSGAATKLLTTAYDTASSVNRDVATTSAGVTKYLYQNYAPSGTSYNFSLGNSGFTFAGSPTEMREGWLGVAESADDRYMILMYRDQPKELVPHGFRYDGTGAEWYLWPAERGHIESSSTSPTARTYHVFCGQWYYRTELGVEFGDGALTAATARSAYYRHCRRPIMAHCGTKYATSRAFQDIAPAQTMVKIGATWYRCILDHVGTADNHPTGVNGATYWTTTAAPVDTAMVPWGAGRLYSSFTFSDAELDEAHNRHVKWRCAQIDTTLPYDGINLVSSYADRNGGRYTMYGWTTFGCTPGSPFSQPGCNSGRYHTVERLMQGWMSTADPVFHDYMRVTSNHLLTICTLHWDGTTGGGTQGRWTQYPENGNLQGEFHGQGYSLGRLSSVHHPHYKAWQYQLTAYTPFKTAAEKTLTYFMGQFNSLGTAIETVASTGSSGLIQHGRDFMWPIDFWATMYFVYGNQTALTYAVNVWRGAWLYTHDQRSKSGSTIEAEGGMGTVPVLACWNSDETFTAQTYSVYPVNGVALLYEVIEKALTNGAATVASSDLTALARVLKQNSKYFLMGADELSPNNGQTLAQRVSLSRPLLRGGYTSGGFANLICGSYGWRWSDLRTGTGGGEQSLVAMQNVKSSDDGMAPVYSTAIDGHTVTVSGANLTFSAATPFSLEPHDPSAPGHGLYFYVLGEPQHATRIQAHTSGATTATLAASYPGTTGAGKSFVVTLNANVSPEIYMFALNGWAQTALLYKQAGETAKYTALLTRIREVYKHMLLYTPTNDVTFQDWGNQSMPTSTRALINMGMLTDAERNQSYFTSIAASRYLNLERTGFGTTSSTPAVATGTREYAFVRIG